MKVDVYRLRTGWRFSLTYEGRTAGGIVDWVSTNGIWVTIGYLDGDYDGFIKVPAHFLADVHSQ